MPDPADLTLADFADDPYPLYAHLRETAPVAWLPRASLWLVTRYEDVRDILLDSTRFVTGGERSPVFDTFGEQMLTVEGEAHRRYRDFATQVSFAPKAVGATLASAIAGRVDQLIGDVAALGEAEIRATIASRLPVLVMLDLFGLPDGDEARVREWYDAFEAALANHHFDEGPRRAAAHASAAFHAHFQQRIDAARAIPGEGLLDGWIARAPDNGLDDAAIRRNALIVLFGGISTVEALILNTLWSLLEHPEALAAVRRDRTLVGGAVNETMRWLAPVQSAMRHPVEDVEIGGVAIPAGATVNAMLGAANRDGQMFDAPDAFRLGRSNAARHLGFATGPHHCLGQHLAKAEVTAVVTALIERLPDFHLAEPTRPVGHEFHQPRTLRLAWRIA